MNGKLNGKLVSPNIIYELYLIVKLFVYYLAKAFKWRKSRVEYKIFELDRPLQSWQANLQ